MRHLSLICEMSREKFLALNVGTREYTEEALLDHVWLA